MTTIPTDTKPSTEDQNTRAPVELLGCPFCHKPMMFRKALWTSDGNVDAIIHADPTDCPLRDFSDGSIDESIIKRWNTPAFTSPAPGEMEELADGLAAQICSEMYSILRNEWDRKCLHDKIVSALRTAAQSASEGREWTIEPSEIFDYLNEHHPGWAVDAPGNTIWLLSSAFSIRSLAQRGAK